MLGIHDYARKNGFKRVVLGLSGGIDSAVVAALACEALGAENVSQRDDAFALFIALEYRRFGRARHDVSACR